MYCEYALLTKREVHLAWSMKDLLYNKKIVFNRRIVALLKIETCLSRETEKKTNCFCDPIKPRESFMFSLF